MNAKKIPYPLVAEKGAKNKYINEISIPKFFAGVHPNIFKSKEEFNLGRITNDFKKGLVIPRQYTIEELLKLAASGRCFVPSFYINDEDDNTFDFVSSTLLVIDVDDEEYATDPLEVLNRLNEICAGLFFTSSHRINGNRYRLAFIFNRTIRSQTEYKAICKQLTKELNRVGIPADKSSQDGLQRVRGSLNGYILSNETARLNVDHYLQLEAKELEARQASNHSKSVNQITKLTDYKNKSNTITFEELKEMAEFIGYIPSGSGQKDDWISCAYGLKSYANLNMITQEQGEELFDIISGGEQKPRDWMKMNPHSVSIGSFISVAEKRGFKRNFKYYYAVGRTQSKEFETVRFDEHVSPNFMRDLLTTEGKILFEAATGTGKTSSAISAAKELSQTIFPQRFFIIAVPTIAIAKQTAESKKILPIIGEVDNIFEQLKNYSDLKQRVIVVTYEMAEPVVEMLKVIHPFSSFSLIVDEIHQFVSSYSYRANAIESLITLKEQAKTFIGLSGTTDIVLKNDFDRHIKVITKQDSSPCEAFGAVFWSRVEGESPVITEQKALVKLLLHRVERGKRLLVFIQNKKMIRSVQQLLVKNGVTTHSVTSDSKNETNSSYAKIINEERFPEQTQVILSTSVMSDGINIFLDSDDYECIVVASRESNFFDPSIIRQCSNRFRRNEKLGIDSYRNFFLFMLDCEQETDYFFNIESSYSYLTKLANNATALLNNEFARLDDKELARMANLEKWYGITVDHEENTFKSNAYKIRSSSYYEQKTFYGIFRKKFAEACFKLLQLKNAALHFLHVDDILKADLELESDISKTLEVLHEVEKLDKDVKASLIDKTFTKDVYKVLNDPSKSEGDKKVITAFKNATTPIHFNSLATMCPFVDYETAQKVIGNVTHVTNTHKFIKSIAALSDIHLFKSIRRDTPTKKVFKHLSKYVDKPLTKVEMNKVIFKARDLKLAPEKKVKEIQANYFEHVQSRINKERYTTLKVITVDFVARTYDVELSVIEDVMNKMNENNTTVQKLVLQIK